ncbi:MAG: permease [Candidatus Saccharimonadales bacterium]
MRLVDAIGHALAVAGTMGWDILWSLILGFSLAAIVQALVRKKTIAKSLGGDKPKNIALAAGFGIASSSCSYAAVALARSLFSKGASFIAAITFEIASTNLVVELGIILALLLGWRFTLAEFIGGPIMIIAIAIIFRLFLRKKILEAAANQAKKGIIGSMEGHAAMDMSLESSGSIMGKIRSAKGLNAISEIFVMEIAAIYKDLIGGLLIAGAIAAWVPKSFFKALFLNGHPLGSAILGPIIGPIIALLSFVCSIGNVPLAAVLFNDGISFGGVISFIFADLIIIPILLIYRKYYGSKMTAFLLGSFYVSMVIAGWLTELIFKLIHLTPADHHVAAVTPHIALNYTSILNIIFVIIGGFLLARFIKSGGAGMLKHMD